MANIHLSTSSNGGNLIINGNTDRQNVHVGDATMPKYVGARAVVERVENGVLIKLTDYRGETEEIVYESIEDISFDNVEGTFTITLPDGRTFTSGSLIGPQGERGQDGSDGADGFSPVATVTKSGSVATITITDKNGTTTATVSDGEGGSLPSGGTAGQILVKQSNEDGDAEWLSPASSVEYDNTLPITSAAVYTEVGNINALLATI